MKSNSTVIPHPLFFQRASAELRKKNLKHQHITRTPITKINVKIEFTQKLKVLAPSQDHNVVLLPLLIE